MPTTFHDFATTTYNQPGLALDTISGITVPGSPNPIFVPMLLTSLSEPTIKLRPITAGTIPLIDEGSNLGYGGTRILDVAKEFPKITMEGTIDSPVTVSGTNELPAISGTGGILYTYPELITMQMEGRATATFGQRIRPRYFRDPQGRVYGDLNNDGSAVRPRIIDFRANYTEGAPVRTSFSMTLMV